MYDLIIKNASIVDGTEAKAFTGDVAVKDGKIVAVGKVEGDAAEVYDAKGLTLAPGFIDIHDHADTTIHEAPESEGYIMQGVTTCVAGNCGISAAPVNKNDLKIFKDYVGELEYTWDDMGGFFDYMEKGEFAAHPGTKGIGTNFACGVGHGNIRMAVMGFENRKPTAAELDKMKGLLSDAIDQGCVALSSGLIYPPGFYTEEDELTELCKVVAKKGVFYETHMRNEGLYVTESLAEAIRTCENAGASLQVSHHKVARKERWGATVETLKMIEDAQARGVDVWCDQYPYSASSTQLSSNVPDWMFVEGIEGVVRRLKDPEIRAKAAAESDAGHIGRWQDIYLGYAKSEKNHIYLGKNMEEIGQMKGKSAVEACFDIVEEEGNEANEVNFGMCEEDIERIMVKPYVMIGSDGWTYNYDHVGVPHPRCFGTFPRVLGHYCRERQLFPLETAVYKMTGLPAKRLGWTDRGRIAEGCWADLVLFDPQTVKDDPDYTNPKVPCSGIDRVYVNGVLAAEKGKRTKSMSGMVIRRK